MMRNDDSMMSDDGLRLTGAGVMMLTVSMMYDGDGDAMMMMIGRCTMSMVITDDDVMGVDDDDG